MGSSKVAGLEIRRYKIDDLKPHPRNPRVHPDAQIAKLEHSLERYGYTKGSVVVQQSTNTILAGHGVIEAMKTQGYIEVDAIVVNIPEGLAEAWMVADNKLGEDSEWDAGSLSALLADLQDMPDIEIEDTGFDIDELSALLALSQEAVVEDGYDFTGSEERETITQSGDLWLLGEHQLLCGDSTKKADVSVLMGDFAGQAILMATDPPYGDSWVQKAQDMQAHGYAHSRAVLHGSIQSDNLSELELREFLDKSLLAAKVAGNAPFPCYVWHGARRIIFEQALLEAGYLVHQSVIWVKPSFVIGRLHYHPRCEQALHGWLRGGGKCPFYGGRNQSDVWEIGRENEGLHPTQKPVELFAIPMRNHTRRGDICYEPFAGSGSQYIAGEQLGRRVFGLEIEPIYCDVIVARYAKYMDSREGIFLERNGEETPYQEIIDGMD